MLIPFRDESLVTGTQFSLASEALGTTRVLTVGGELDLSSVGDFDAEVGHALAHRPEVFLLDLSEMTFVDSTGIRSVLYAERRATRGGTRLHIIPAPEMFHRIFALCGLDAILPFVPQGQRRHERG